MEERKMEDLMIDYLDGNLTGELNEFVAKNLKKSPKWAAEFTKLKTVAGAIEKSEELEPPASLKAAFNKMLADEIGNSDKDFSDSIATKTIYWNSPKMWLQVAASLALLIIGVLGGIKLTSNANEKELLALREEMEITKTLVLSSLNNQSASSRISAVNASYQISTMDNDIVNALVKTMNNDENANVRIAAIDALRNFSDNEKVRAALIESLSSQEMPIVQLALIDLMVQLKGNKAAKALQQIIDDKTISNTVRDEASYSLYLL